MPRLKQVASTCQAPEKLVDPAWQGVESIWPTESNPLTFPGPGRHQICMGGRARSAPSIPRVGLSKCRGGSGLGLTAWSSQVCQGLFRGLPRRAPMCSRRHGPPTITLSPTMLSPSYSQGHTPRAMLSPPCSRRYTLAALLSLPCSQGHALTAMLSRQGSRVCLRAGSRGRLTGRLTCMLIYRLHR
jgi:hypothetical protein